MKTERNILKASRFKKGRKSERDCFKGAAIRLIANFTMKVRSFKGRKKTTANLRILYSANIFFKIYPDEIECATFTTGNIKMYSSGKRKVVPDTKRSLEQEKR